MRPYFSGSRSLHLGHMGQYRGQGSDYVITLGVGPPRRRMSKSGCLFQSAQEREVEGSIVTVGGMDRSCEAE